MILTSRLTKMTMDPYNQTESASINEVHSSPPVQLPAYSECDEHSNAGFEMANTPLSPSHPAHMTAEQEKAYLASREAPSRPENLQQDISETRGQLQEADTPFATTARGLQVPTSGRKVSSGFPYPDMLSAYGIGPQEWSNFTSEITQAAHMTSKDWSIVVGAGVATFLASGVVIGWLGLIPAFVVGHRLQRSAEKKHLRAARDTGDLEAKLLNWNQNIFAPKGFLVRLDLPGEEPEDMNQMDVYAPKKWNGWFGAGRNRRVGSFSTGTKWAQRAEKAEKRAQRSKTRKTTRRGRIVILPLNGVNPATQRSSAINGEATSHNAAPIPEKELYVNTVREV